MAYNFSQSNLSIKAKKLKQAKGLRLLSLSHRGATASQRNEKIGLSI